MRKVVAPKLAKVILASVLLISSAVAHATGGGCEKTWDSFKEFLTAIGVEVNDGQNKGLLDYNRNLVAKNKCFAELTRQFYDELQAEENGFPRESSNKADAAELDDKKPSLKRSFNWFDEHAAKIFQTINDTQAKPGSVWEKALRFSGGDKNLAMTMIGICGHDNVFMEVSKSIECTAGRMHWPQSLGAEVDIPQEIKARVSRVQGNGKGYMPAKYYHLLGGAYVTCIFLRKNTASGVCANGYALSDFFGGTAVAMAPNSYRAGRLCEDLTGTPAFDHRLSLNQVVEKAWALRLSRVHGKLKSTFVKPDKEYTLISPEDKHYLWLIEPAYTGEEDRAKFDEIVKKSLARADAFDYFRRDKILFTLSQECKSAQYFPHIRTFLKENATSGRLGDQCARNNERCKNARQMMETWLVDFEWTNAQHQAGMRFAGQNCTAEKTPDALETSACKALNSRAGNPQTTEVEQ